MTNFNAKDVKVGDYLKLRTDLEDGKDYGKLTWWKGMFTKDGKVRVTAITPIGTFIGTDRRYYSPEMFSEIVKTSSDSVKKVSPKDLPDLKAGMLVRFRKDLKPNTAGVGGDSVTLTFFQKDGYPVPGCVAQISEVLFNGTRTPETGCQYFEVEGSYFTYSSDMIEEVISTGEKPGDVELDPVEEPEKSAEVSPARQVKNILKKLDELKLTDRVYLFIDENLEKGDVVRIKADVRNGEQYWGCYYVGSAMIEPCRTAKVVDIIRTGTEIEGDRYILDKKGLTYSGCTTYRYSVPMFDPEYTISHNPTLFKKFMTRFSFYDKVKVEVLQKGELTPEEKHIQDLFSRFGSILDQAIKDLFVLRDSLNTGAAR